jgi:uncharacterized protein YjbI with pentapeptide repeats
VIRFIADFQNADRQNGDFQNVNFLNVNFQNVYFQSAGRHNVIGFQEKIFLLPFTLAGFEPEFTWGQCYDLKYF